MLLGSFVNNCGSRRAERILNNISAAGGASLTYWPFPASGYFALRRFRSPFLHSSYSYTTPHACVGLAEFSLVNERLTLCGFANTSVTLVPESDTHLAMYESGSGIVISWMFFVLSFAIFGYVVFVLRKATSLLGTWRTVTHIALYVDLCQLVVRSFVVGPWGWVPFSYVLTSDFSVTCSQATNCFVPTTTILLIFRVGQLIRVAPFTRREATCYKGVVLVICTAIFVTIIQVFVRMYQEGARRVAGEDLTISLALPQYEIRYALSFQDSELRDQADIAILNFHSVVSDSPEFAPTATFNTCYATMSDIFDILWVAGHRLVLAGVRATNSPPL